MSTFKMKTSENGVTRYWIGNPVVNNAGEATIRYKFIKKENIPDFVLKKLVEDVALDEKDAHDGPPKQECLFCGEYAKMTRMVELQTVYLCDEHYYDKSTGKVSSKLKELNYV